MTKRDAMSVIGGTSVTGSRPSACSRVSAPQHRPHFSEGPTQTRLMSLVEAMTNIVVGYGIAVATQLVVFPAFGLRASISDNLTIGVVFTIVSFARSYTVRRVFERSRRAGPHHL